MANNAKSPTPSSKSTTSCNPQNTNLHKLQAMGHSAKFEVSGGKKTPA